MIVGRDELKYVYADVTSDVDLAGSTVQLDLDDGTRYTMTWQADAVVVGGQWVRTARTDAKFAGSAAAAVDPDVKPGVGPHEAFVVVTAADGQILVGPEVTLYSL